MLRRWLAGWTLTGANRADRPASRGRRKLALSCLAGVERLDRRDVPAVVVPSGFAESGLVSGLRDVAQATVAPDGRIFAAQFDGAVRVIKDGQLLPTPFLQLDNSKWQGTSSAMLMSVELDPNFAQNQYVYLLYRDADSKGGTSVNRLSRVTASGDVAAPGSLVNLFEYNRVFVPPGAVAHNGGNFTFGKDGKIYIPTGDLMNSDKVQTLDNMFGKVLRINPDGSIPEDNPFYNQNTGANRAVYAYGLRNPFTIASDQATGQIYVADVGEQDNEEVNSLAPGINYGWPLVAGRTADARFGSPIYAYTHHDPDTRPGATAVVGGAFYNPASPNFPGRYRGLYFFGDYNNGWIKTLDPSNGRVESFATGLPGAVTDYDFTPDGRLIYVSFGTGEIRQIQLVQDSVPDIPKLPDATTVLERPAILRSNVVGAGPFAYRWQIDGVDLPGETGPDLAVPGDLGLNGRRFRVIVSNAFGTTISNEAVVTVKNDHAPGATIKLPRKVAAGRLRQGQLLSVSASAFDIEDRRVPAARFSWTVDLLHNDHVHPGAYRKAGVKSIRLRLPKHAEDGTIRYQVNLTVTDSKGNATTVSKIINLAG